MPNKLRDIAVAGLACLILSGCGAGMQPKGPDEAEVKKIENSLPADQQIRLIQSSPMPAAEKQKRIAEIQSKYHLSGDVPLNANPGQH